MPGHFQGAHVVQHDVQDQAHAPVVKALAFSEEHLTMSTSLITLYLHQRKLSVAAALVVIIVASAVATHTVIATTSSL